MKIHKSGGFTIVELAVVITVIGVLATVGFFSIRGLDVSAKDRERESDATSIARRLEIVYNNQLLGSPTYPGEASVTADSAGTTLFGGSQPDITQAPNSSAFSIVKATNTTATPTGVLPQPTTTTYVYQPLTLNGSNAIIRCTTAANCRSFNLYYLKEATGTVMMIRSAKQQ